MSRVSRCVPGFRPSIVGLVAAASALAVAGEPAEARRHHYVHARHAVRVAHRVSHHSVRENDYSPPRASIVIDANSGKVLQETSADSLRHPASLTKIMTLYLLFERLESGKIKLSTEMPVSEHAADQAPTKLGLRSGQHIVVEDAIRGIITRSANDAAVVVAEALGGDEESFAKLMTAKAHALGMGRTTYVNASGLPDDDQVTTARDQATLGRAIQERFPRYYKYFSIPSFTFRGEEIRNHDHLLGQYGVDGIKTGYTRASGFNLVTSLHRDGRYVVAVVMGGSSASSRDAHMRQLIEDHLDEASTRRTAPAIAEAEPAPTRVATRGLHVNPPPTAAGGYSLATVSTIPAEPPPAAIQGPVLVVKRHVAAAGSTEPIRPIAVKTVKVKLAPMRTAALAPPVVMIPVTEEPRAAAPAPPVPPAQPAPVAAAPAAPPPPARSIQRIVAATVPTLAAAAAPAPPPVPVVEAKAEPKVAPRVEAKIEPKIEPKVEPKIEPKAEPKVEAKVEPKPEPKAEPAPKQHTGWIIQIGAFGSEGEAKLHLDEAKNKVSLLGRADPFTEAVTKGDKIYYRARFAGLEKGQAEETCRKLRRSDMQCMTVKN
jgi:D-alanyl-D-alanine carboxypeptidase